MDDKNKTISIDSNLWSVSSKQNRSRKKKDQIKSKTEFDNKFTEQLNTLTEMLNKSKEPEYGILKNGNKPTYRTYMNTINNNNNNTAIENSILNSTSNDSTNNEINKIKLGLNYRKRTAKVQIRGKKSRRKIKKQI